ncbi:MAG TPA: GNAT family N-acetyltransferase [Firmicutes bacterium]|nr:GNAT family N-acetyltransferase [Bacillota bacterium]
MGAKKRGSSFAFYRDPSLSDGEIALRLTETQAACPALGGVPVYRFGIVCLADGQTAGRCELRVGFSESVYYAGNIGYSVTEAYRGRGYALRACRLLLTLAERHRMPQVVITCRPDNAPSRRICEALGARLRGVVPLPPEHPLYQDGDREVCRYILNFDAFR